MPISRVRSVTDTSMMFMIPMPPTSSDTAAMLASSSVITCEVAAAELANSCCGEQHEVLIAAGADAVALAQQFGDLVRRRRDLRLALGRDQQVVDVGDADAACAARW